MVKIILCMIVKNESKIIERCINSALPVIDAISICDTGSTDNTVEEINRVMKEKNLQGFVYNDPWKNFGHNRSRSFTFCVETANKLNFDLTTTYALLLDADMCLKITPQFNKNKLKESGYMFIQKNSVLTYYNTRLVRLSDPWTCIGVTHEYWGGDGRRAIKYEDLYIDDINDGGAKADKFERDIRLLLQGIQDEPNNERYYFYLAQSYMDCGQAEKGIEWYKKRVEKGGWGEEVFYSLLRIGHGFIQLKEIEKAIFWYLQAHNYRSSRAEAIYEVANKYRLMEKYTLAYMFAKEAKKIPFPKDDVLFIRHDIYNYLIDFELSVCCFYAGDDKLREGYECCKSLLKNPEVPQGIKDLTLSNIKFYREKLGFKDEVKVDNTEVKVEKKKKKGKKK